LIQLLVNFQSYTPTVAANVAIENIEKYNKYSNAFVDVADPNTIRVQAEESTLRWKNGMISSILSVHFSCLIIDLLTWNQFITEKTKSPLDGVVMGYKMNLCTEELRTTCGSNMLDSMKKKKKKKKTLEAGCLSL
jgi:aspartyl-tRNA(Asn)/glutamyl-tRNA(Gln) amidotransferase subunit A